MKTKAAVKHFGTVEKLAEALQITTNAIYQWGENVPRARAVELELMTEGKLKAPKKKKKKKHPWRTYNSLAS